MFMLLLKRRIIEKDYFCRLSGGMKWIVCIKFVLEDGHVTENTEIIVEMNFIYQKRNLIHFMPLVVSVFFLCIYIKRGTIFIKNFLILRKK